ncbi:MAG TPA: DUF975 family protein [Synergistetes bacterium]|nr:DUF975 family protein [Synergistota bacterium]
MSKRVEIKKAFEYGWETFKENALFFIVLMTAIGVPMALLGILTRELPWFSVSAMFLRGVCWVLRVLAVMVVILVSLSYRDKGSFDYRSLGDLQHFQPIFLPYLLGTILYSLLVGVGMVLLIAPGVYVLVKYQFTPYVLIDRGSQPVEALKEAGNLANGVWLELFLLMLAIMGINFLGVLVFGIGLIVTIPVTLLAHSWVYRSFVPSVN